MDMRVAGGGGGGGCTSRYGGGGWGCGCGSYDMSMVDRTMLKFRPIAPKPAAVSSGGYGSGESMTVNDVKIGGGKSKRRYVNVKGKINKRNKNNKKSPEVVTLPLMPETPDRNKEKQSPVIASSWLSFKTNHQIPSTSEETRKTVSFVTVERVTKTPTRVLDDMDWREMEKDTCPRFISDGGDKVVWTNKAYREMTGGGDQVVVLVTKSKEGGCWPAEFTCHVRVTWGSGVSTSKLTVPCDTWILKSGGSYAWRLDVKAALSLGR